MERDQGTRESLETRPGYRKEPWNETRIQGRALEQDQGTGISLGTRPGYRGEPWNETRAQDKALEQDQGAGKAANLMEYEIV